MEKKPKNKKGNTVKWLREDYLGLGQGFFYNNISKMAKAFGEHLSPMEITDLMLKIIEALTHEEKTISQLPTILTEIYHHLPNISEPATKEKTLMSVCHLASKGVNQVVDHLLEYSLDCNQPDDNIEALTHEEKTISQAAGVLLISFLEECVMDMEELPTILTEICQRLPNISEPATKEVRVSPGLKTGKPGGGPPAGVHSPDCD
ncbi:hypothetical protein Chor_004252, partial [Crotalus horridus]